MLPEELEIARLNQKNGERVLLVLDSSVCLDILNLIREKEASGSDKEKIFNLIEYSQKNKINQISLFALLESCYDRKTLEIQTGKLIEFRNKIDFAFQYPLARLKKFDYAFNTDVNLKTPQFNNKLLKILIEERLNLSYAALLKICEIAKNGLSANFAEKNITAFINWMENDLDIILGIEYTLALHIFGGNSRYRTMIKLGAKKERILKAAWGTAWDLFHAKMSCNKEQLSYLVGYKVHPVFVTKDAGLYELISPKVSAYTKFELSKLSILENNPLPPGYSVEFREYLNNRMLKLASDRNAKYASLNIEKVKSIIKNLEDSLGD